MGDASNVCHVKRKTLRCLKQTTGDITSNFFNRIKTRGFGLKSVKRILAPIKEQTNSHSAHHEQTFFYRFPPKGDQQTVEKKKESKSFYLFNPCLHSFHVQKQETMERRKK